MAALAASGELERSSVAPTKDGRLVVITLSLALVPGLTLLCALSSALVGRLAFVKCRSRLLLPPARADNGLHARLHIVKFRRRNQVLFPLWQYLLDFFG